MKEREKERREIKKMPDKETLEAYLEGACGPTRVSFNIEKGEFEWLVSREEKEEDV